MHTINNYKRDYFRRNGSINVYGIERLPIWLIIWLGTIRADYISPYLSHGDKTEGKQLPWYGHLQRMLEHRWPKKVWVIDTSRKKKALKATKKWRVVVEKASKERETAHTTNYPRSQGYICVCRPTLIFPSFGVCVGSILTSKYI